MPDSGIKRREFLKAGMAISAGAAVMATSTSCASSAAAVAAHPHSPTSAQDRLRGFIVSDAHFGWPSSGQPSNERIARAIKNILRKFPDLDLFTDSGDPHHNIAVDTDLEDWVDIIGNGIGSIPFMFVGGNHDTQVWDGGYDPEERTMALTSLHARPYYSMDIKGIHIISLPQLVYFSYLSDETLEWLKLDLEAAAGRTTLIISHNSLAGTTFREDGGDTGYRIQAMSQDIYDIIDAHPNVVTWFHGHNHDYVAVMREGVPHISNGRIGGFDPAPNRRFGDMDNLGGIYFEITATGLMIGAYSGAEDRWIPGFVAPGQDFIEIKRSTTLDVRAMPTISYGHGAAAPGSILPVRRHTASADNRAEILVRSSGRPFINDNVDFRIYTQRLNPNFRTKHLGGFALEPHQGNELRDDLTWNWNNPGITLLPNSETKRIVTYGINECQHAYLRVDPAREFEVELRVDSSAPGVVMSLSAALWTSDRQRVAQVRFDSTQLESGGRTIRQRFDFRDVDLPESIYSDPANDRRFQLVVEAAFANLVHAVEVRRLAVRQLPEDNGIAAVKVDGEVAIKGNSLTESNPLQGPVSLPAADRYIVAADAPDGRPVCWHMRELAPLMQVRNAQVMSNGRVYRIGQPRNAYSRRGVIIMAPFLRTASPHISLTEGVAESEIPLDQFMGRHLSIEVKKLMSDTGYVEFANTAGTATITGGERVASPRADTVRVRVTRPGRVDLVFA